MSFLDGNLPDPFGLRAENALLNVFGMTTEDTILEYQLKKTFHGDNSKCPFEMSNSETLYLV